MAVDVTIVIAARAEGELLPATVASIGRARTDLRREVVVVDDGTPPGSWRPPPSVPGLPLEVIRTRGEGAAAARNRGAARGRGDLLCFCDAHIAVADGWLDGLLAAMQQRGAAAAAPALAADRQVGGTGYGYTWTATARTRWLPRPAGGEPTAVPFLPGACLLAKRTAFAAVGGFDAGLVPWGHEDTDLSLALWLAGHDAVVAPAVLVRHHFRQRHPYLVLPQQVETNLLRVGYVHFSAARLTRFAGRLGLARRLPAVRADPGAARRRARLLNGRRRDDDWFCRTFALPYWG